MLLLTFLMGLLVTTRIPRLLLIRVEGREMTTADVVRHECLLIFAMVCEAMLSTAPDTSSLSHGSSSSSSS